MYGGGVAGVSQNGTTRLDSTRVWVREVVHDMANSTRHTGRRIRVWLGLATARCGTGSLANCVYAVPA